MGKKIYFSGLNGLRAIASLAVVLSHTLLALENFGLPAMGGTHGKAGGLMLAGFGVSIFFALSGFLITYLLQEEKEQKGIDIGKFYMRRILRIWPLYYLYMLAAFLVLCAVSAFYPWGTWALYIFYLANIPFALGTIIPPLAHYWSLGTEEQFYLYWPWLNKYLSAKKLLYAGFGLFFGLFGLKIGLHFSMPHSFLEALINVAPFHCMILGGIGAVFYRQGNALFLRLADNKLTQLACWGVMLLLFLNKFHIASIIDNEFVAGVGLLIIIGQINLKNRLVNLEIPIFDFLGKISYGIYVIHPILIFTLPFALKDLPLPLPLRYVVVFGSVLGLTIGLAYLSYTYFESRFLRIKHRYTVVESAASRS